MVQGVLMGVKWDWGVLIGVEWDWGVLTGVEWDWGVLTGVEWDRGVLTGVERVSGVADRRSYPITPIWPDIIQSGRHIYIALSCGRNKVWTWIPD